MLKDAKIYKIDYIDEEGHLHHKYYTCLTDQIAIDQFNAGCEHKHIDPHSVTLYRCAQGCHKWALVKGPVRPDQTILFENNLK